MQPIYKGNQREPGNYRGTSLLPVFGKIYSGILPLWQRDWLLHHKKLPFFRWDLLKAEEE
jgi:hypothetical protein